MQLNVMQSASGAAQRQMDVSDAAFDAPFNEALVHQVVTAYLAGGRAGTKAQKTRSMVRGGGRKPWKQKGTGNARAGTIRSPLWRGGGKIFAAVPRDHSQKVNTKMYRGALRAIVSELNRQGRLKVIDALALTAPRTKELIGQLGKLGVTSCLLVVEDVTDNLALAARNLANVDVVSAGSVDPVSLVAFENVIATEGAIKKLEERLQ